MKSRGVIFDEMAQHLRDVDQLPVVGGWFGWPVECFGDIPSMLMIFSDDPFIALHLHPD